MELIPVIEAIKKHGVSAVLVLVIYLMFNFFSDRLEKVENKLAMVEAKLYDCLEDRIQFSKFKGFVEDNRLVGILTEKKKYGINESLEV